MDRETALSTVVVRKNRAPDRVGVQHDLGFASAKYLEVKKRFGRRLTLDRADHAARGIHFEDLIGGQASLVDGACGYGEAKRIAFDDRAEIAARPENPASAV